MCLQVVSSKEKRAERWPIAFSTKGLIGNWLRKGHAWKFEDEDGKWCCGIIFGNQVITRFEGAKKYGVETQGEVTIAQTYELGVHCQTQEPIPVLINNGRTKDTGEIKIS